MTDGEWDNPLFYIEKEIKMRNSSKLEKISKTS